MKRIEQNPGKCGSNRKKQAYVLFGRCRCIKLSGTKCILTHDLQRAPRVSGARSEGLDFTEHNRYVKVFEQENIMIFAASSMLYYAEY